MEAWEGLKRAILQMDNAWSGELKVNSSNLYGLILFQSSIAVQYWTNDITVCVRKHLNLHGLMTDVIVLCCPYLPRPIPTENQLKFRRPQNISGASQRSILLNNTSRRGLVSRMKGNKTKTTQNGSIQVSRRHSLLGQAYENTSDGVHAKALAS